MLNPRLETFIAVADAGSFNRAAESLFISAPAAIKQINVLEEELGCGLFVRTNHGLRLTEAGESFYKDVKYLLHYYESSIERAKKKAGQQENLLRVGISPMTPGQFLSDLWPRVHPVLPDMKITFVPFENQPEIAREKERHFGEEVDVTVGALCENFFAERGCAGTWLSDEPLRIGVPLTHPFYEWESLTMRDLYGCDLMMIYRGWNRHMDKLRDEIEARHPFIRLTTFDFYSVEAFNRCERDTSLIVTIDRWKDIHPLMKVLPVDWGFTMPFGILHAPEPSPTVRRFLDAVQALSQPPVIT